MPLYEKYRPQTLDDFVGHDATVKKLCRWMEAHILGKTQNSKPADVERIRVSHRPNVVLVGNAGVGKTTLATVLFRKYDYDIVELNASDVRTGEQVDAVFKEIMKSTRNVVQMLNHVTQRIAILMDEIDGLSTGDKGGMKRVQYYLQKNAWYCPIILTSNIDNYTRASARGFADIKKSCNVYTLGEQPPAILFRRVESIVEKESLADILPPTFLGILIKLVCEKGRGDFRYVLNTVELVAMLAKASKDLDLDDMITFIQSNQKDAFYELYEATNRIFRPSTTPEQCFLLFDLERYNLPIHVYDALYERIGTLGKSEVPPLRKTEKSEVHHLRKTEKSEVHLHRILRSYVSSIAVEDVMYGSQRWELFDTLCALTVYATCGYYRQIAVARQDTAVARQDTVVARQDTAVARQDTAVAPCSRLFSRANTIRANMETRTNKTKATHTTPRNYHLWIESVVYKLLENPYTIRHEMERMGLTRDELMRLLKSSHCYTKAYERFRELGIF